MPQTTVGFRQPVWLGEGQVATTSIRRLEGAIQNYVNGTAAVLPFGRVVQRNPQGQAILPSAAATAASPVLGVTILNEKYGIPMGQVTAPNLPGQAVGTIAEQPVGYPVTPTPLVEVMAFGDIVMQTEEAITSTDVATVPVFYRVAGGTAPNNVVGRVRKSADPTPANTDTLPNAKFMTTAAAGGFVVVRIGTFAGAAAAY